MKVPILKQGNILIASVQSLLTDKDMMQLQYDLMDLVNKHRSNGVIVDLTVLDVLDSFACRILRSMGRALSLQGAKTIIVGIHPDVAFAMVQLGLSLEGVVTLLDLEDAIEYLKDRN